MTVLADRTTGAFAQLGTTAVPMTVRAILTQKMQRLGLDSGHAIYEAEQRDPGIFGQ